MFRSFKYRLFTNANQGRELAIMLETHRRLYNACLEERKTRYEADNVSVTFFMQCKNFSAGRKTNPYYARLNVTSAYRTIRRVDRSFKEFFARVRAGHKPGYPRFKGVGWFNSFHFAYTSNNWADGIKIIGNKLRIQHVGMVRMKLHRPIIGKAKQVVIKREAGKWFAIFHCDLGDVQVPPSTNPPVGIDMGIESFLTTSDGQHEPSPSYLKTALPELRRCQRSLSRKKRGGTNRRKARVKVAKVFAKVRNRRKEHHHQVALRLVRRHGFIAAEGLNIRGMLKNGRLARAISDAGWSGFLLTLRHKAENAGVAYVEVNSRGTSQLCSGCGAEVRKDLSVRQHRCMYCGLSLHRDENAARNILARGLTARAGPAGLNAAVG